MNASLDRALLGEVSGFIAQRLGLHFPEDRWPDLARGLECAGKELGFGDLAACLGWLRARSPTSRELETLASHLTVGETYFFRDPASFRVLESEILTPLVAARTGAGQSLRLWSAGCCSGEEAYSLAISCARVVPDLRTWNVSVLATDINPKFLAKAEAGVYSEWSFRGVPGWLRERFFSPVPGRKQAIAEPVKSLVQLGYLNLAEDAYPSLHNQTNAMDVIFCRNVLMYFTPAHQRRVVAALYRCLVDGGCLLVNPAEASPSLFPMFALETIGDVTLFRKRSAPAPVASKPEVAESPPAPAVAWPEPPVLEPASSGANANSPAAAPPPEDCLALARAHADQGRLEAALAACRDALASERTDPVAHFLCATICGELGRHEEAIGALGKVLYLDQDFVLAHHALGILYRRLGKPERSSRHLAIALELLTGMAADEIVPESGGMTAGRLAESVRAMRER